MSSSPVLLNTCGTTTNQEIELYIPLLKAGPVKSTWLPAGPFCVLTSRFPARGHLPGELAGGLRWGTTTAPRPISTACGTALSLSEPLLPAPSPQGQPGAAMAAARPRPQAPSGGRADGAQQAPAVLLRQIPRQASLGFKKDLHVMALMLIIKRRRLK